MEKETWSKNPPKVIDEETIEWIITEIMKRISTKEEEFRCLLVFHASMKSVDLVLESLSHLKDHPRVCLKAAWTENASNLFDIDRIRETIGCEPTLLTDPMVSKYQEEADLIVLPTLTLSGAAKIACCIRDDASSLFVSKAILDGKHILAVIDGVILEKEHTPTAYLEQIRSHLLQLAAYGIELTIASKVGDEILRIADSDAAKEDSEGNRISLREKMISRELILDIPEKSRVRIPADAIILPLARDMIYAKKIEIIRE